MGIKSFEQFMNENERGDSFLFEMANFNPQHTGLKEVIWVSVKNANHGPRIKIFKDKQAKGVNFSVTIEDTPRVIGDCFVNSKELENIKKFIILNKTLLIKYWEYQLDTVDLALNLQKV